MSGWWWYYYYDEVVVVVVVVEGSENKEDNTDSQKKDDKKAQPKKTPRLLRSFAQTRVVGGERSKSQPLVPEMSQYSDTQDIDMDAGTAATQTNSLSFSTSAAPIRSFSSRQMMTLRLSSPQI